MGKKIIIFAILCVMAMGVLGAVQAHAGSLFSTENANYIKQAETIDGSIYLAGDTVQIDGTVNGDVYCAAQTVVVTGTVNGDILCGAQTLTLNGVVKGNIRLAGQTISIQNKAAIAGSASVFGQVLTIESGSTIAKDTTLGVQSALLNGTFGRDVIGGAQTLTLNGATTRDMKGDFEELKLAHGATVGGTLEYTSGKEAVIDGNVRGDVKRIEPKNNSLHSEGSAQGSIVMVGLVAILWTLVITLALALILPKKMETLTKLSLNQALLSGVFGFSVLFGLPIVSIILMISILGLPLGIIGLLVWFVLILMSSGVTSYYIGRMVLAPRLATHRIVVVSAAATLLGVSFVVPIVGIFTVIGSLLFGMGAIVYGWRYEYDRRSKGTQY